MKQAERPGLHRWSRHEYRQLIDYGLLDEDDPIELIDGLLLVKEPQHSPQTYLPRKLKEEDWLDYLDIHGYRSGNETRLSVP